MISHTTQRFRSTYAELPERVRLQAQKAFALFKSDPQHPSLHFKQVHPTEPIYSARVSQGYRALAIREDQDIVWFWIGTHSDYERVIRKF